MRSRSERLAALLIAAALFAAATPVAWPAEQVAPLPQVTRVIEEMKADPALNGHHTEHQLRWKERERDQPTKSDAPNWLIQLMRWIAGASRGVVWILGAIGVALVAVFAWRWASVRSDALRASAGLLPSFVNELDIRPESLPADIAGAALALARRGKLRAALSLLYRGALSRLVHERGVPILGSSTEGECVRLAARVLPSGGGAYFESLVSAWQTEVYAGRSVAVEAVIALCAEFDAHLAPLPNREPDAKVATA